MWSRFAGTLFALGVILMAVAQEGPAPQSQAGPSPLSVVFEKDRLSVRMQNASMRDALGEIERRTSVKIAVSQAIEDHEISADFSLPLDLGLHALLGMYDSFFYYGASGQDAPLLRAVWVFPKGAALTMAPVPLEAWAGGKELEAVSSESDPKVRQAAYEALMARPDSRSRELVIQAIRGARERDADVRQRVLAAAMSKGLSIPPEVLSELARGDGSEQIRWMALDALSQSATARQAAEAALTDPSSAVRQKAEEILSLLAAEGHRREGNARNPDKQP